MALKPFEHSIQPTFARHPFNFCWTNVGEMLKPLTRALSCYCCSCFFNENCTEKNNIDWFTTKCISSFYPSTYIKRVQLVHRHLYLLIVLKSRLVLHWSFQYPKCNERKIIQAEIFNVNASGADPGVSDSKEKQVWLLTLVLYTQTVCLSTFTNEWSSKLDV